MSKKTNHDYQKERFIRLKERYKKFGIPFTSTEYNSVKEIEVGLKKTRISLSDRRFEGAHLAKFFGENAKKRMDEGLYVCKNTDGSRRNINTIYYNEEACLVNVGKVLKAIDINSCYWNTSYIMGVIDEHIYKMGFKKQREYKDSRNVAIGCLGKNRNIVVFDGISEVVNYYSPMLTACIRLDIVDYVYNTSLEISKALGNSLLFYLTDCFYVTEDAEEKCISLIEQYGYTCKQKPIQLLDAKRINKRTFALIWLKENAEKKSSHHFNMIRHEINCLKPIEYGK